MSVAQKWIGLLVGVTAFGMVLANPNAFYKAAQGIRSVTAGSLVDVSTGGKKIPKYS